MATTTFSYTLDSGENNASNFTRQYILEITEGEIIPSTAQINNVTFEINIRVINNFNDYMYVHYRPNSSAPSNTVKDGKNNITAECPILASSSDAITNTTSNWITATFTAIMDPSFWYLIRDTTTLPICVSRQKNKSATNFSLKAPLSWTCTVNWEDNRKKPNYPSGLALSTYTAAISQGGDSLVFTWEPFSMPSGASNGITGLSVHYKETNENTWTNLKTNLSPTATSFITVIPNIIGTYHYVVQALTGNTSYEHTIEELFNGGYFKTLTVSNIQKLAPPSNIEHSLNASYIGSEECSAFTLRWTGSSNQTNNNVIGYQLVSPSSDNYTTVSSSTRSYTFNPVNGVLEPGYYGVRARGSAGADYYSDFSGITLTRIASPTIPTISANYATTVQSSNFEIQWYAVNSNSLGVKRVTYNLYYRYENGNVWLPYTAQSSTESTKYSFSTGSFEPNRPFQIGIQAKYEAQGTGYTVSGVASTNYITYHADFTLPSNFWVSHSDVANGRDNKKDSHIYNSITLRWNAVNDTSIATNKFNYYIYRAKNNGQYECLNSNSPLSSTNGIAGQILSYKDNNLNGENTLTYYIDVEAIGYAKKVSSAAITVNVVKPIEITLFEVNRTATTKDNIYVRLNWNSYLPDQFDTDEIYADVILWYGNNSSYLEQAMPLAETDRNVPIELDLLLTGTTGAWPSLREAVINQGNPQPQVNLQLILRYGAFSGSAVESSRLVTLNFFTAPDYASSYLTLTYPSDRNPTYFNPGDTAVVRLSNFVWYNAIGGSEVNTPGVTITKYLTSSFSSNTFKFNSSNYAFVPIPAMAEDRNDIVLTLVTTVYYKGADISKDYISSITCNPIIARWIEEPVSINNVQLSEDGAWIEGNLTVPERYCGSDKYENTVSIEPILVSPEVTYTFFFDKDDNSVTSFTPSMLKLDNFNKQRIIPFRIFSTTGAETKYSDITLNFSVNFKNTSNNILTIDSILYRFFTAEVDFAIRKGKIGVNVSKEFGTTDDKTVLEINSTQSSGDAPLVRIAAADSFESSTIQYISLMDNSGSQKKIYTKDNKVFIEDLHIDMPEIDSTKLLSTDGDLIFSVSNIEGTTATTLKLQSKTDSSKNFALVGFGGTLFYQNAFGQSEIITEDNLIDKFNNTSLVDMLNNDIVSARKGHALVLGNNGVIETSIITTEQLLTLSDMPSDTTVQAELDKKANIYNTIRLEEMTSNNNEKFGSLTFYYNEGNSLSSIFEIEPGKLYINGTLVENTGTIQAAVYSGTGIRYGETEPNTNLVKGQIWLKPKFKESTLIEPTHRVELQNYFEERQETDGTKYWISTNRTSESENSTTAKCRLFVSDFGSYNTLVIHYDGATECSGATFWDYGAFSLVGYEINSYLAASVKYAFRDKTTSGQYTGSLTYTKAEFESASQKFIDIIYVKDESQAGGNDYLKFWYEFK